MMVAECIAHFAVSVLVGGASVSTGVGSDLEYRLHFLLKNHLYLKKWGVAL